MTVEWITYAHVAVGDRVKIAQSAEHGFNFVWDGRASAERHDAPMLEVVEIARHRNTVELTFADGRSGAWRAQAKALVDKVQAR